MAKNKLFYSKNFIADLLIIEALRNSDHEAPKTSQQILGEVEKSWIKFFPNEPLISKSTIRHHVRDMNQSGLYDIKVHEDNKRGYYNAGQVLTTEETAVIGAAVYFVSSLSVDEKKNLFKKMKRVTDTDGSSILYSFERQISLESNSCQQNLQKIKIICKAVVEGKKISFDFKQNSLTEKSTQFIASPYFVVLRDNELFLAAQTDNSSKPMNFKLNLVSKIEILSEEFQGDKDFSLKRPPSCKDASPVELKISFPESFIEKVIQQFGIDRISQTVPNGKFSDGERRFRTTIYVNENEGLYQWLRQHCDKVKVNFPYNVRNTLKRQLIKALAIM